jgi:hypothetical protein
MVYVNSQASVARGIIVTINGVEITEITDDGVPMPQTSTDDLPATNQNSGDWKEYKAGRKDGGECDIKANAVDGDAGQIALAAAAAAGSTCLFVTTFPGNASQSFYGVVKTFNHTVDGGLLKITSKVKVSGAPVYSITKSALTGLTVTGEVVFPAFGGTTMDYKTDVATGDTTAVIVPVQAAAGATITVNGVTVASGGNGSVTLGAAGTVTKATVVVQELLKAAVVYNVWICRAAP